MIIDLKRSIDLRLFLMSGVIFIPDNLALFFATLPYCLTGSFILLFLLPLLDVPLFSGFLRLALPWKPSSAGWCCFGFAPPLLFAFFWIGLMNLSRKLEVSIYGVFKIARLAPTTLLHKSWVATCPLATRSSLSLAHHWTIGNHFKLQKGQQQIVIFVTDSVLWSQYQRLFCFGQDADALIVPLSLFTFRHFIR